MESSKIIEDFESLQENILYGFTFLTDNQKINLIMKVDLIRLLEAKQHHDIEVYNILAQKYNIATNSVRQMRNRVDKSNPL